MHHHGKRTEGVPLDDLAAFGVFEDLQRGPHQLLGLLETTLGEEQVPEPGLRLPGVEVLRTEAAFDPLEFVRTIAVARILMPASHVRLSAGREEMSDETQALGFLAGANSIFYGEKLLTTDNPDTIEDRALMQRLGIEPEPCTKSA